MGYHTHHAIIVTSWDEKAIEEAHAKAEEIFGPAFEDYQGPLAWVSPISPMTINGYRTFFVGPDGSKEGWDASDEGDRRRSALIAWLDGHERGFEWAEVAYYDEGGNPCIERASSRNDDESFL